MRDGHGSIICSGYGKLGKALEAVHTEIIACLQALQRAAMLGIQKVVLETDAVHVVQAINQPGLDRSSASGLLRELKECLLCNFSSFVVAHNPRSCNLVALWQNRPI
jgi:ribonuclease HI